MRVEVDPTACCASGMCALTAPEVFDQDDDTGSVVLLQPEPPAELHRAVRSAEDLCPARAITVTG